MRLTVALLVGIAFVPGVSPAAGPARVLPAGAAIVPDQVLVKFASDAVEAKRHEALNAVGGSVVRHIEGIGWHVVRVAPDLGAVRALALLDRAPAVALAEPNYRGTLQLTPNDRCYLGCVGGATQWNLGAVNAQKAWDLVPGAFYTAEQKKALPQIKVAVLDTRIDTSLADWANASSSPVPEAHDARNGGQLGVVDGADIVPSGGWSGPAAYHGSFVAGILGAAAHNGTDVAGLGYRATIVPVTVVDGNGATNAGHLAAGIDHARSVGARVINMSLGLSGPSAAVQDAILAATDAGALLVAAAGNNGSDQPFYPAWHDQVMSVTAVDEADRPGVCTNHSAVTAVAAPGVGIVSLDPSRPEKLWVAPCGTSTAAPHVSALAALLFAQDPSRTPEQVRAIIERNADDDRFFPGRDAYFGAGRINFERALRDGVQPIVGSVRASFPRNTGGTSSVTASATAVAPTVVAGAEYFIDVLGAPGTGSPMTSADGSFGGRLEELVAQIPVPISFKTGVHRLFVRATDGTTWGPASVGVLIADRTSPQILGLSVSPTAFAVAGQGARISFTVSDDYSSRATYTYTVTRQLPGGLAQQVFESAPKDVGVGVPESTTWTPANTDVGNYEIKLTVKDEAQNPAFKVAGTFVI